MSRFRDCFDLAKSLPYFTIKDRRIQLREKRPAIDMHAHLGFSFLLAGKIDLLKAGETEHEFPEHGIPIDLDLYSGANAAEHLRKEWHNATLKMAFGSRRSTTHTIPNMLEEMDRFGIRKSVAAAVDMPLFFNNTKNYLDHKEKTDRLVFFCCINPINIGWKKEMADAVKRGAKGLKIHPYVLLSRPEQSLQMSLIREWSKYKLPILFHCGHCGIEPSFTRKWLDVEGYERPLREFPDTKFMLGHAGSGYHTQAIALAKRYPNAYLELSGQSPKSIREIIASVDNRRILYGSDWPYYSQTIPMAKFLIATEGDDIVRSMILHDNAVALLSC